MSASEAVRLHRDPGEDPPPESRPPGPRLKGGGFICAPPAVKLMPGYRPTHGEVLDALIELALDPEFGDGYSVTALREVIARKARVCLRVTINSLSWLSKQRVIQVRPDRRTEANRRFLFLWRRTRDGIEWIEPFPDPEAAPAEVENVDGEHQCAPEKGAPPCTERARPRALKGRAPVQESGAPPCTERARPPAEALPYRRGRDKNPEDRCRREELEPEGPESGSSTTTTPDPTVTPGREPTAPSLAAPEPPPVPAIGEALRSILGDLPAAPVEPTQRQAPAPSNLPAEAIERLRKMQDAARERMRRERDGPPSDPAEDPILRRERERLEAPQAPQVPEPELPPPDSPTPELIGCMTGPRWIAQAVAPRLADALIREIGDHGSFPNHLGRCWRVANGELPPEAISEPLAKFRKRREKGGIKDEPAYFQACVNDWDRRWAARVGGQA